MRAKYADIRSRIPEAPIWYDEAGVPRYALFDPKIVANAYAREAALMSVLCQECRTPFIVSLSQAGQGGRDLADEIERKIVNYGDPPNVGCCPTGYATTTVPLRVLEFWRRQSDGEFVRKPELEIDVGDQWHDWLASYGLLGSEADSPQSP